MPYKVERGKVSFQCGTLSQKWLQVQHLVLRQKLLPHKLYPIFYIKIFRFAALKNNLLIVVFSRYEQTKIGKIKENWKYMTRMGK